MRLRDNLLIATSAAVLRAVLSLATETADGQAAADAKAKTDAAKPKGGPFPKRAGVGSALKNQISKFGPVFSVHPHIGNRYLISKG